MNGLAALGFEEVNEPDDWLEGLHLTDAAHGRGQQVLEL